MRAVPAPDPLPGPAGFPAPLQRAVSDSEAGYPEGLRELRDAPPTIYLRGTIPPLGRAVAIVGSRAASPYGLAMAGRLAADLARLGFAVVSGLARGIDAAAHAAALDAGGTTVAVLPCGLDSITPRHHRALAARVAERGGLLSEWESGEPRARAVFVRRNRLIAALASAVVVVEAAEISGALSTAAAARRLRRAVLAVPGDVDRPTARGCHALIRSGAALCETAGDIVRALPSRAAVPGPEARLLEALEAEPHGIEALAERAGLAVADALSALLHLQWAGAAEARPGQRWVKSAGRGT